jgi:hypothetical protein
VKLQYQVNSGLVQFAVMYDDGQHHDRLENDGLYGCILPPFQVNETLSWQVYATDNQDHATLLPCSPALISFQPSSDPQLFINEFMADNDITIADEYGEYDNWVEIYNGDDEAVWLGDKYLSDNLSNEDKWQLPDYTIQPGAFLIIWADGQPEQGPFHASYKLNDEGEELGIFDNETTGYFLIDSISWGLQTIDISYGRQNDGELPWIFFTAPTPGYSNETSGLAEDQLNARELRFFPNPVTDGIIRFKEPFTGKIMDLVGRTIWSGKKVMQIDVNPLPAGCYIILDLKGSKAKVLIP